MLHALGGRMAAVFMLATSAPLALAAQEAPGALAARVDAIFAALDRGDGPGAAVAVVLDGRVVLERGYGLAQLEHAAPITPATVFHVASVSKQFTAFAIILLAQDGKLSLDDPIQKHVPELHDFGVPVRIRHLIHHTSGVRDQWELLQMAGWRMDDVITRDQIMALLARQRELNFEPGAEYLYSNAGYTLLAEIVERVSGQPFDAFLEARVFGPLGMGATHVHHDHLQVVPERAYSYRQTGDGWQNAVLSYANQGATSLFTTPGDLARWLVNLETGDVGGPAAVARLRERGVLNSGDTLNYAFALMRGEHRGRTTWGHSGSDAGFRAQVLHFPAERLGVVVLSNAANGNPGRLAAEVADVFLGVNVAEESAERRGVQGGGGGGGGAEPVWQPDATELAAYVGSYYSPELDVIYHVAPAADGLVTRHFKLGELRTTPRTPDEFRMGSRTARFERSATGGVTGFRLTGGRVRNLLFLRLADGALPGWDGR